MTNAKKKAYLMLANGQIFEGYNFGVEGTSIGEIVFTTSMTGYQETLTDPSYFGQMVVQTFPLIGNYGTNSEDFESAKAWVKGYIVREWCEVPSNFRCEKTVDEFLKEQNVIGIYGIDTRALTRTIREHGVMNGVITTENVYEKKEELLAKVQEYNIVDAVKSVTCQEITTHKCKNANSNVVLMDFGHKRGIVEKLLTAGCNVTVVPGYTSAQEIIAMNPDGIMLSNGPGDPAENVEIIETIKELIKAQIPMFGICLGHQLVALANGGETIKLKYGHRGSNQPVIDLQKGRTYVTTQNHNYAVVEESLNPEIAEVSHYNVNDKTCEGVRYKNAPAFTVQFHPEACAGPEDTACLFKDFIGLMNKEVR